VIDARRGEVFYALYRHVPGGVQRVSDYRVATADDLASDLEAAGEDCLLVGDGAVRYRDAFESNGRAEHGGTAHAYPSAEALVQLAHPRALREDFVQPWELAPLYLRKADAEINWEQRVGTGAGGRA
jgi:tRNA threonylcarbamoyladenosine biosynthesis protein TsaB